MAFFKTSLSLNIIILPVNIHTQQAHPTQAISSSWKTTSSTTPSKSR